MTQHLSPEYAIYKDLRQKILVGQLKEGDRLVETALAADYQASRLHIKSALRLLAQENLAEHIPQCGFVAKEVTNESMEEIIELRLALEGAVFRRLLVVATEDEVARLRKMVQRVAVFMQNDMIEDTMEEVDNFYSFVYQVSRFERITAILSTYNDYLKIIRRKSARDTEHNQASLQLLMDMMDAIEKRDEQTLLRHIDRRRIDAE